MINNKLSFKKRFKKLIFWKNKKINGIIDYISPFTIKGWYKGIDNSSEIQLRINDVTILKTYANEYRKDVCKKLGCEGNFGFSFTLNKEFGDLKINDVSIIAKNGKNKYDKLIYKKSISLTQNLIKSIFSNKLYGIDGHVDEINNQNMITGWASNFLEEGPVSIWVHSDKKRKKPKKVICNQLRNDLIEKNINTNSGFIFDLNLENSYAIDEILFFTFDEEGLLKIPCEKILQIKSNTSLKNTEIINEKNNLYSDLFFQEKINTSNKNLRRSWENLYIITKKINSLDEMIDQEISKKNKLKIFLNILRKWKKI